MNVNEGWEEQENKSMEEMRKTDSRQLIEQKCIREKNPEG